LVFLVIFGSKFAGKGAKNIQKKSVFEIFCFWHFTTPLSKNVNNNKMEVWKNAISA
jgi:hypothetical protein